jgi:hypothetical protein
MPLDIVLGLGKQGNENSGTIKICPSGHVIDK